MKDMQSTGVRRIIPSMILIESLLLIISQKPTLPENNLKSMVNSNYKISRSSMAHTFSYPKVTLITGEVSGIFSRFCLKLVD